MIAVVIVLFDAQQGEGRADRPAEENEGKRLIALGRVVCLGAGAAGERQGRGPTA